MNKPVSGDKTVVWAGNSLEDLQKFPTKVMRMMGHAIRIAQGGDMHIDAKVMQGFGGAGVLEVVENFMGDTYRAVYTVKFEEAVYVLHSFQKKSKKNDETPRQDVETIKRRLRWAQAEHDAWMKEQGRKNGHAKGRRGDTGATP